MLRNWWLPVFALGALVVIADYAQAHHGYAAFDTKAVVTLKASATDLHFVNPHCIVEFEVKGEKGELQQWQGELPSPGRLTMNGWTPASLKPGDEFTVTGYRAKNGSFSLWVTKVVLADGHELKIGNSD